VRDVYELLREREMDCARLQTEIDALRLVILLLTDEEGREQHESPEQENAAPEKTGTDGPFSSPLGYTEWSFWKRRGEAGK